MDEKRQKGELGMKKALLVISFGTSYEVAMKAIENIEKKLSSAFPDYDFNRAFTSGMIIKKLLRTKNQKIETTTEALGRLYEEGYEEVLCQPTHIINGIEYDKMCRMIAEYRDKFKKLRVGTPLLTESEDFGECAKRVMENMPKVGENEALVFMGHGTDHFANGAYSQIENTLRHIGYENVYVGTVEGFPDLSYVEKRLKKKGVKRVYLAPLMIVAGDHARNDLAGEEEDSWKSILEAAGYEVEVKLQGIGEYDSIAELFVEHAKNA